MFQIIFDRSEVCRTRPFTFSSISPVAGCPALDAGTYDADADKERDKVIYSSSSSEMEPQAIHKLQTPAVKDSLANRNNAHRTVKNASESGKNANKPSSHSDDSVLSFNFLYYLFEKYKLQDIVD